MRKIKFYFKNLPVVSFIRDIKNLFYIAFKIRKIRKTSLWKELNIRHDWVYRAYTVINMKRDDFMDDPEALEYKFLTACKPIFTLFEENGLAEIVIPKKTLIDGTYSYLLHFKHRLMVFSFGYIFSRLFFIGIIIWLYNFLINNTFILNLFKKIGL